MQRDPIKRLASGMIRSGVLSEKEYIELERSLSSFIDSEWEKAKKKRTASKARQCATMFGS